MGPFQNMETLSSPWEKVPRREVSLHVNLSHEELCVVPIGGLVESKRLSKVYLLNNIVLIVIQKMCPVLTRTVIFLSRLVMVEIMGKPGKEEPVVLTAEMTRSIDVLMKTRKAVGIQERNPYVFAMQIRQSLQ